MPLDELDSLIAFIAGDIAAQLLAADQTSINTGTVRDGRSRTVPAERRDAIVDLSVEMAASIVARVTRRKRL